MNQDPNAASGGKAEIHRLLQAAKSRGRTDNYAGKRSRRRVKDGLNLEVTTDPAAAHDLKTAFMHDISEEGIAMWSRCVLPVRSIIYVRECSDREAHPWLRARVTRCDRGIRGFFVGCLFEPVEPGPATGGAGVKPAAAVAGSGPRQWPGPATHIRRT